MSWLDPGAAWWLLLLPALLLLYLFRPRSQRKRVSSLRLWEKLPQVDRPRARLRRPPLSLLLILQALLLLAGALALLRPAADSGDARHVVAILDASASMQARQGASSRFELARGEVRQLISSMSGTDRMTLLRTGRSVSTVCSLCNRQEAERALEGVRAGAGPSAVTPALGIALGLAGRSPVARGGAEVETVVISDGGFPAVDAALVPPNTRFVVVGGAVNNIAVTALSARSHPDGSPGYAAYARVDNFGSGRVELEVTAHADTVPLQARGVTLEPEQHAGLTWRVPAGTTRLTVSTGASDALPADDSAVLFLPVEGSHRVALISAEPDIYRRVASGVPALEPVVVSAPEPGIAFTIIEGRVSPTLPTGSLLLVNPEGELFPREEEAPAQSVRAIALGGEHPVLSGVDLAALLISDVPQMSAPDWLQPLVTSEAGTPLVLAGEEEGRRVVVLAFDPRRSNLPKLAAFPLLFANIVDWLYPLARAGAVEPGEPLALPPGTTVSAPGERSLTVGESGVFAATEDAGVYSVEMPGRAEEERPLEFAVNVTGAAESAAAVAQHPELERAQVAGGEGEVEGGAEQEFWSPLAGFALALVGLEWLVYCWKRGRL